MKSSLLVLVALLAGAGQRASSEPAVIFVCEHGAAKSVIATAYFNKIAAERGLAWRATFRGTSPQEALSIKTVEGLRRDGLAIPDGRPVALADRDVATASHIFAIGCTLPAKATASGKAADWSDVPEVSDGYAATRDAIRRHVERLLDDLQRAR